MAPVHRGAASAPGTTRLPAVSKRSDRPAAPRAAPRERSRGRPASIASGSRPARHSPDRLGVALRQREGGHGGPRPLDEEAHRPHSPSLATSSAPAGRIHWHRQRRHPPGRLACHPQRLAARRQDLELRAGPSRRSASVAQAATTCSQLPAPAAPVVRAAHRLACRAAPPPALLHAEHGGHRLGHQRRGRPAAPAPPATRRPRRPQHFTRELQGEPRLAHAGRPRGGAGGWWRANGPPRRAPARGRRAGELEGRLWRFGEVEPRRAARSGRAAAGRPRVARGTA
jgi:hypothetical protein